MCVMLDKHGTNPYFDKQLTLSKFNHKCFYEKDDLMMNIAITKLHGQIR